MTQSRHPVAPPDNLAASGYDRGPVRFGDGEPTHRKEPPHA